MGWVDLVKTLINIVCQVNAAWEKDFKKRRLTHNTLPKVEKKMYDRLHRNANVILRIKAFHGFHVNKLKTGFDRNIFTEKWLKKMFN